MHYFIIPQNNVTRYMLLLIPLYKWGKQRPSKSRQYSQYSLSCLSCQSCLEEILSIRRWQMILFRAGWETTNGHVTTPRGQGEEDRTLSVNALLQSILQTHTPSQLTLQPCDLLRSTASRLLSASWWRPTSRTYLPSPWSLWAVLPENMLPNRCLKLTAFCATCPIWAQC